jgi:ATP-binding cassette subfamily F protein uup
VLENKLTEYNGTLIIVSHDREFLDNVVTSTIVFEDDGRIQEYVGGYSDWLRQGHALAETDSPYDAKVGKQHAAERRQQRKPTKLSYKDQRELDKLPAEIESMEASIVEMQQKIADPDFYSHDHAVVQAAVQELANAEVMLEQRVERWSELEILQASIQLE